VASTEILHVGGRAVRLHPLGPGHTDTDLVVHVPDAVAWIVGDVVEASGPPMYGSGCFPLDLPHQLAFLLDQVGQADVVVPGHGPVVDRDFLQAQHAEVEDLAQQIRAAQRRGDTVGQALSDQARWPFPVQALELAVQRGYLALAAQSSTDQPQP
jgi:glyoxylase-like metal-dependent hydrolase (beta-lactamase superfamily II)